MENLTQKILIAYKNVDKPYKMQDLADWINNNGGINGRLVTRNDVKRVIVRIAAKVKGS